jgi:transcriptional regulator with PAS, ATPase and Fis domain
MSTADDPTKTIASMPNSMRVRAVTLHVTKGPDAGRVARVDQPTFTIGVGDAVDLRLTDPGISREHLRLMLGPGGVRLRDEGSKNGTYMGSARIHELTLTGDAAVTIGGTTVAIAIAAEMTDLPISSSERFGDAIGTSPIMRHLFASLEKAAASELTILLEGESGVGKDLLARAIHAKSPRAQGPFVVTDCGAIPENLIESELFGHERGSFTGADHARRGVFEEASGGTLFLDEIGELPLEMQPKLLRALEAREVRPVGASSPRPIDVRVIAATNRRLAEASRTGEFRSDLFYRLAVVRTTIPPLRERSEDILPIARALLHALKPERAGELPADFASMLAAYSWPGNVRELRNVIERHAALGQEGDALFAQAEAVVMSADDELARLPYHEARKIIVDRFEEAYVPRVLARADNVISRAADFAGVSRPSLYRMLERLRLTDRH